MTLISFMKLMMLMMFHDAHTKRTRGPQPKRCPASSISRDSCLRLFNPPFTKA